jgi:hypothetical protein
MGNESNYCRVCGSRLVPGARFCSKCGTSVNASQTSNEPSVLQRPFRAGHFIRERIAGLVEKFRAKGAVNPETARTASELGLGPRFEMAMDRRLGRTGIFIKIDNKYYLSEERLKEFRDQLATRRRH